MEDDVTESEISEADDLGEFLENDSKTCRRAGQIIQCVSGKSNIYHPADTNNEPSHNSNTTNRSSNNTFSDVSIECLKTSLTPASNCHLSPPVSSAECVEENWPHLRSAACNHTQHNEEHRRAPLDHVYRCSRDKLKLIPPTPHDCLNPGTSEHASDLLTRSLDCVYLARADNLQIAQPQKIVKPNDLEDTEPESNEGSNHGCDDWKPLHSVCLQNLDSAEFTSLTQSYVQGESGLVPVSVNNSTSVKINNTDKTCVKTVGHQVSKPLQSSIIQTTRIHESKKHKFSKAHCNEKQASGDSSSRNKINLSRSNGNKNSVQNKQPRYGHQKAVFDSTPGICATGLGCCESQNSFKTKSGTNVSLAKQTPSSSLFKTKSGVKVRVHCPGNTTSTDSGTIKHTSTACGTINHTSTACGTFNHTSTACGTINYTSTACGTFNQTCTDLGTITHTSTDSGTTNHISTECVTINHTPTDCVTINHTSTYFGTINHTSTDRGTINHTSTDRGTINHTSTDCVNINHTSTDCDAVTRTESGQCETCQGWAGSQGSPERVRGKSSNVSASQKRNVIVRQTRASILRQIGQQHTVLDSTATTADTLKLQFNDSVVGIRRDAFPVTRTFTPSQKSPARKKKCNFNQNVKEPEHVDATRVTKTMTDSTKIDRQQTLIKSQTDSKTKPGRTNNVTLRQIRENRPVRLPAGKISVGCRTTKSNLSIETLQQNQQEMSTLKMQQAAKIPGGKNNAPRKEKVGGSKSNSSKIFNHSQRKSNVPLVASTPVTLRKYVDNPSRPKTQTGPTISGKTSLKDHVCLVSSSILSPGYEDNAISPRLSLQQELSHVTSFILPENKMRSVTNCDREMTSVVQSNRDMASHSGSKMLIQQKTCDQTSRMLSSELPKSTTASSIPDSSGGSNSFCRNKDKYKSVYSSPNVRSNYCPRERTTTLKFVPSSSSLPLRMKSPKRLLSEETETASVTTGSSLPSSHASTSSSVTSSDRTARSITTQPEKYVQEKTPSLLPTVRRQSRASKTGMKSVSTTCSKHCEGSSAQQALKIQTVQNTDSDPNKDVRSDWLNTSQDCAVPYVTDNNSLSQQEHRIPGQNVTHEHEECMTENDDYGCHMQGSQTVANTFQIDMEHTTDGENVIQAGPSTGLLPVENGHTTQHAARDQGEDTGEYSRQGRIDHAKTDYRNNHDVCGVQVATSGLSKHDKLRTVPSDDILVATDPNKNLDLDICKVREAKGGEESSLVKTPKNSISMFPKNVKENENNRVKKQPPSLPVKPHRISPSAVTTNNVLRRESVQPLKNGKTRIKRETFLPQKVKHVDCLRANNKDRDSTSSTDRGLESIQARNNHRKITEKELTKSDKTVDATTLQPSKIRNQTIPKHMKGVGSDNSRSDTTKSNTMRRDSAGGNNKTCDNIVNDTSRSDSTVRQNDTYNTEETRTLTPLPLQSVVNAFISTCQSSLQIHVNDSTSLSSQLSSSSSSTRSQASSQPPAEKARKVTVASKASLKLGTEFKPKLTSDHKLKPSASKTSAAINTKPRRTPKTVRSEIRDRDIVGESGKICGNRIISPPKLHRQHGNSRSVRETTQIETPRLSTKARTVGSGKNRKVGCEVKIENSSQNDNFNLDTHLAESRGGCICPGVNKATCKYYARKQVIKTGRSVRTLIDRKCLNDVDNTVADNSNEEIERSGKSDEDTLGEVREIKDGGDVLSQTIDPERSGNGDVLSQTIDPERSENGDVLSKTIDPRRSENGDVLSKTIDPERSENGDVLSKTIDPDRSENGDVLSETIDPERSGNGDVLSETTDPKRSGNVDVLSETIDPDRSGNVDVLSETSDSGISGTKKNEDNGLKKTTMSTPQSNVYMTDTVDKQQGKLPHLLLPGTDNFTTASGYFFTANIPSQSDMWVQVSPVPLPDRTCLAQTTSELGESTQGLAHQVTPIIEGESARGLNAAGADPWERVRSGGAQRKVAGSVKNEEVEEVETGMSNNRAQSNRLPHLKLTCDTRISDSYSCVGYPYYCAQVCSKVEENERGHDSEISILHFRVISSDTVSHKETCDFRVSDSTHNIGHELSSGYKRDEMDNECRLDNSIRQIDSNLCNTSISTQALTDIFNFSNSKPLGNQVTDSLVTVTPPEDLSGNMFKSSPSNRTDVTGDGNGEGKFPFNENSWGDILICDNSLTGLDGLHNMHCQIHSSDSSVCQQHSRDSSFCGSHMPSPDKRHPHYNVSYTRTLEDENTKDEYISVPPGGINISVNTNDFHTSSLQRCDTKDKYLRADSPEYAIHACGDMTQAAGSGYEIVNHSSTLDKHVLDCSEGRSSSRNHFSNLLGLSSVFRETEKGVVVDDVKYEIESDCNNAGSVMKPEISSDESLYEMALGSTLLQDPHGEDNRRYVVAWDDDVRSLSDVDIRGHEDNKDAQSSESSDSSFQSATSDILLTSVSSLAEELPFFEEHEASVAPGSTAGEGCSEMTTFDIKKVRAERWVDTSLTCHETTHVQKKEYGDDSFKTSTVILETPGTDPEHLQDKVSISLSTSYGADLRRRAADNSVLSEASPRSTSVIPFHPAASVELDLTQGQDLFLAVNTLSSLSLNKKRNQIQEHEDRSGQKTTEEKVNSDPGEKLNKPPGISVTTDPIIQIVQSSRPSDNNNTTYNTISLASTKSAPICDGTHTTPTCPLSSISPSPHRTTTESRSSQGRTSDDKSPSFLLIRSSSVEPRRPGKLKVSSLQRSRSSSTITTSSTLTVSATQQLNRLKQQPQQIRPKMSSAESTNHLEHILVTEDGKTAVSPESGTIVQSNSTFTISKVCSKNKKLTRQDGQTNNGSENKKQTRQDGQTNNGREMQTLTPNTEKEDAGEMSMFQSPQAILTLQTPSRRSSVTAMECRHDIGAPFQMLGSGTAGGSISTKTALRDTYRDLKPHMRDSAAEVGTVRQDNPLQERQLSACGEPVSIFDSALQIIATTNRQSENNSPVAWHGKDKLHAKTVRIEDINKNADLNHTFKMGGKHRTPNCLTLVTQSDNMTSVEEICSDMGLRDKHALGTEPQPYLLAGEQHPSTTEELKYRFSNNLGSGLSDDYSEMRASGDYSEVRGCKKRISLPSVTENQVTRNSHFESGCVSDMKSPDVRTLVHEIEDNHRHVVQIVADDSVSITDNGNKNIPSTISNDVFYSPSGRKYIIPSTVESDSTEDTLSKKTKVDVSFLSQKREEIFENMNPETVSGGLATHLRREEYETLKEEIEHGEVDLSSSPRRYCRGILDELSPVCRDNLEIHDKTATDSDKLYIKPYTENSASLYLGAGCYECLHSGTCCYKCEKVTMTNISAHKEGVISVKLTELEHECNTENIEKLLQEQASLSECGCTDMITESESVKIDMRGECKHYPTTSAHCDTVHGVPELDTARRNSDFSRLRTEPDNSVEKYIKTTEISDVRTFNVLHNHLLRDGYNKCHHVNPSKEYMCACATSASMFMSRAVNFDQGNGRGNFDTAFGLPASQPLETGSQLSAQFQNGCNLCLQCSRQDSIVMKQDRISSHALAAGTEKEQSTFDMCDNAYFNNSIVSVSSDLHESNSSVSSYSNDAPTITHGYKRLINNAHARDVTRDIYSHDADVDKRVNDKVNNTLHVCGVLEPDIPRCVRSPAPDLHPGSQDNASNSDAVIRVSTRDWDHFHNNFQVRSLSSSSSTQSAVSLCREQELSEDVVAVVFHDMNNTGRHTPGLTLQHIREAGLHSHTDQSNQFKKAAICWDQQGNADSCTVVADAVPISSCEATNTAAEGIKTDEPKKNTSEFFLHDDNLLSFQQEKQASECRGYNQIKLVQDLNESVEESPDDSLDTKQSSAEFRTITSSTVHDEKSKYTVEHTHGLTAGNLSLSIVACSYNINSGSQSIRKSSSTTILERPLKETSPLILEKVYELFSKASSSNQRDFLRPKSPVAPTSEQKAPVSKVTALLQQEKSKANKERILQRWKSAMRKSKVLIVPKSMTLTCPDQDERKSPLPPPSSPTPSRKYKWEREDSGIWRKLYVEDENMEDTIMTELTGKVICKDQSVGEVVICNDQLASEHAIPNDRSADQSEISNDQLADEDVISKDQLACEDVISNDQTVSEDVIYNDQTVSEDVISNDQTVSEDVISNDQPVDENIISNNELADEDVISKDQLACKDVISNDQTVSEDVISNDQPVSEDVISTDQPVNEDVILKNQLVGENISSKDQFAGQGVISKDKFVVGDVISKNKSAAEQMLVQDRFASDQWASKNHFITNQVVPKNHFVHEQVPTKNHLANEQMANKNHFNSEQMQSESDAILNMTLPDKKQSGEAHSETRKKEPQVYTDVLVFSEMTEGELRTACTKRTVSRDEISVGKTDSEHADDVIENWSELDQSIIVSESSKQYGDIGAVSGTTQTVNKKRDRAKTVHLMHSQDRKVEQVVTANKRFPSTLQSWPVNKMDVVSGKLTRRTFSSFSEADTAKFIHHGHTLDQQEIVQRPAETLRTSEKSGDDCSRTVPEKQKTRKYTWPTVAESLKRFRKSIAAVPIRGYMHRARDQQLVDLSRKGNTCEGDTQIARVAIKTNQSVSCSRHISSLDHDVGEDCQTHFLKVDQDSLHGNGHVSQPNMDTETTPQDEYPANVVTEDMSIEIIDHISDVPSSRVGHTKTSTAATYEGMTYTKSARPLTLGPPNQVSATLPDSSEDILSHCNRSSQPCWSPPSASDRTLPPSPIITLPKDAFAARVSASQRSSTCDLTPVQISETMSLTLANKTATVLDNTKSLPFSDGDKGTEYLSHISPLINEVTPMLVQSHQQEQPQEETSSQTCQRHPEKHSQPGLHQENNKQGTPDIEAPIISATLAAASTSTTTISPAPEVTSVTGARRHAPSTKLISVSVWDTYDGEKVLRQSRKLWASEEKQTLAGISEIEEAHASHDSTDSSCYQADSTLLQASDDCMERVRASRSPVRPPTKQRKAQRRSLSLPSGGLSYGDVKILYKDGHFVVVDACAEKAAGESGEMVGVLEDVFEETEGTDQPVKAYSGDASATVKVRKDGGGCFKAGIICMSQKCVDEHQKKVSGISLTFGSWDTQQNMSRTKTGRSIFYSLPRKKGQNMRPTSVDDVKPWKSQQSLVSQAEMERRRREEEEVAQSFRGGSGLKRNNSFTEAMGSTVMLINSDKPLERVRFHGDESCGSCQKQTVEESHSRRSRAKGPGFIQRMLQRHRSVSAEKSLSLSLSSLKSQKSDFSSSSLSVASSVSSTSLQQTDKHDSRDSSLVRKLSFRGLFKRRNSEDVSAKKHTSDLHSNPPIAAFLSNDDIGAATSSAGTRRYLNRTNRKGTPINNGVFDPAGIDSLSPYQFRLQSKRTSSSASGPQGSLCRSHSNDESNNTPVYQADSYYRRARSLSERTGDRERILSVEHLSGNSSSEHDLSSPDLHNSDGTLTPRSISPSPADLSMEGDKTLLASPTFSSRSHTEYHHEISSPKRCRNRSSNEDMFQKLPSAYEDDSMTSLNQNTENGEVISSTSYDSGIQNDSNTNSSAESIQAAVNLRRSLSPSPTSERPKSDTTVRWADLLEQVMEPVTVQHSNQTRRQRKLQRPTSDTDESLSDKQQDKESEEDNGDKCKEKENEYEESSEGVLHTSESGHPFLLNASSLGNISSAVAAAVGGGKPRAGSVTVSDVRVLVQSRDSLLNLVELRRPSRDTLSARLAKFRRDGQVDGWKGWRYFGTYEYEHMIYENMQAMKQVVVVKNGGHETQ